ncbi:MAG: PQQ-binding-like beta-propeller repeat protein [Planctomycetota bacterium]
MMTWNRSLTLATPFTLSFILITVFSFGQAAQAQESKISWPQFRGPDANPVSKQQDLPDEWSKSKNIEWSTSLDGRGWSSPIVVGDKVFVTSAVIDGESKPPQVGTDYSNDYVRELSQQGLSQEEIKQKVMERDFELPDQVTLKYFLVCLDLNTGKEQWKKQFFQGNPPGGRHRKNSFASETPTTDGKHVFVYIGNLGLFAFDLDGNKKWNTILDAKPVYMEFGTGSSPVVCNGNVIVVNDNEEESFIAAYHPETGKEVWKTKRSVGPNYPSAMPKSGWATPFIWKNELRTEIVTVQPGSAVSYDVDGNELWRLKGCTPAPAASSFAYNGQLYLNGGKGSPIFAIQPGAKGELTLKKTSTSSDQADASSANSDDEDSSEPKSKSSEEKQLDAVQPDNQEKESLITWQRPRAGTYIPTPVIYDGGVYVIQDNGILQRLDAETGNQSYKERLKDKGADFTTSPWAYNGKVFFHSEQGDTYVVEAGEEFKLVRVNQLGEFSMASPAIVGNRLLLRTQNAIYCIRNL